MARGWESKSIESQMEEAAQEKQAAETQMRLTKEQMEHQRVREGLILSRTRILNEIEAATHIRHRLQLEAALAHLDLQIKNLEV